MRIAAEMLSNTQLSRTAIQTGMHAHFVVLHTCFILTVFAFLGIGFVTALAQLLQQNNALPTTLQALSPEERRIIDTALAP